MKGTQGRHLAPSYVINKNFIPAIAERLTQGNPTVSQLIWTDLAKMNFNCENKLRSFNKPVLIIQGKHDIIKAETAEKAHKVLSNSKIVFLEHCIHYGWLDNEKDYFQNILYDIILKHRNTGIHTKRNNSKKLFVAKNYL